MHAVRCFGIAALVACAACGATTHSAAMPEYTVEVRAPKAPRVEVGAPHLVRYPDLDVSYVANAVGEVYHHRRFFYTYFDGDWFYAQHLRGPWKFIEMKFVPPDLFRARAQLPSGVTR